MYEDCIAAMQALSDAAERLARRFARLVVDIAGELERDVRKRERFGFCRYTGKECYYKNQWIPVTKMHRVQDRS